MTNSAALAIFILGCVPHTVPNQRAIIPSKRSDRPTKEAIMKRVWTVLHHKVPRTDAQRRWDQAYQLLLLVASPSICTTQQEQAHACRNLCAGLDEPPSPSPDDRTTTHAPAQLG